jgi:hypothetical protein
MQTTVRARCLFVHEHFGRVVRGTRLTMPAQEAELLHALGLVDVLEKQSRDGGRAAPSSSQHQARLSRPQPAPSQPQPRQERLSSPSTPPPTPSPTPQSATRRTQRGGKSTTRR